MAREPAPAEPVIGRTGAPSRQRLHGLARGAWRLVRTCLLVGTTVSFFALWFLNPRAGRFAFAVPPLLALATFVRSRAALILWSIYVFGFLVFVDLRMISAEIWFPARFDYVIALERALFFGQIPSVVLQERLYRVGSPSTLDLILISVHFSFFLVPHAVAVWLSARSAPLFRRYILALVATCWAGLLFALLVPTAPPWLAGADGRIPHVYRIMRDVMRGVTADGYVAGIRAVGENDVAAMPSLHTALTVLVALAAAQLGRLAGIIGWTYVAAMALALVYLGEHYVVDLLAGAGAAWLIWSALASRQSAASVPHLTPSQQHEPLT
jgi:membrane-associated phospholipid phosphatase